MANTPQSKKRARQNERRNAVNTARRSRIRTFLRKVEEAIDTGDKGRSKCGAAGSPTRVDAGRVERRVPQKHCCS